MRVISGKYRSRILDEVSTELTRETKDRVKESIFNSINNFLFDATVLDLFAGSGSLGIEAISRGAKSCVFTDKMVEAINTVKSNIKKLHIENCCEIYFGDYQEFLTKTYQSFDIILLDPPYHMEIIDDIVKEIARKKLLHPEGVIVCLYSKNNAIKIENNDIIEYKTKRIGVTNVSYLKWGV